MFKVKGLTVAAALLGGAVMFGPGQAQANIEFDFHKGSGGLTSVGHDCPAGFAGCGAVDINADGQIFTKSGLTLTMSDNTPGTPPPDLNAYYDLVGFPNPPGNSGFGVDIAGQIGGGNEEIETSEVLRATLSAAQSPVKVVVFTDEHQLFSGQILIDDGNGPVTVTATNGVITSFGGLGASTTFDFSNVNPQDTTGYYIGAIVVTPIPGAAWLFGSGLLGFGWLRRRWRRRGAEAVGA